MWSWCEVAEHRMFLVSGEVLSCSLLCGGLIE